MKTKNDFSYEEIIQKLNNGEIVKLCFYVEGYGHYRNCKIYQIMENPHCLQVELTKDNYEKVRLWKFDDEFKLFYFRGKGTFTLKQIWDKIRITEIIFSKN